jgi:hypothetical protein
MKRVALIGHPRIIILPLAIIAIGLASTGCGSDNSGESTTSPAVSIPAITAPVPTPTSTSVVPETATSPGLTTTGKSGTTYNPNAPDSATNDVPPAKGSPQAQFEKQCQKNPAACG